jgi:hypothetical protein
VGKKNYEGFWGGTEKQEMGGEWEKITRMWSGVRQKRKPDTNGTIP